LTAFLVLPCCSPGNKIETEADHLLLKLHDQFMWFPHMWSHMQAQWFNNVTELCSYMDINRRFSVVRNILFMN